MMIKDNKDIFRFKLQKEQDQWMKYSVSWEYSSGLNVLEGER